VRISVIMPIWRDHRAGGSIVALHEWAAKSPWDVEIIACGEQLPGQLLEPARLLHICPAHKGRCVQAGVMASIGSRIIICDADLPVSMSDLDRLVESLDDYDAAVGRRHAAPLGPSRPPLVRRIASVAFRRMAGILFQFPSEADPQCGVKAFRASAARQVFAALQVRGLAYDVEVMYRLLALRFHTVHVPVHWKYASSTISVWRDSPRMLADLLRLWKVAVRRIHLA
jgi:hypothetical protein